MNFLDRETVDLLASLGVDVRAVEENAEQKASQEASFEHELHAKASLGEEEQAHAVSSIQEEDDQEAQEPPSSSWKAYARPSFIYPIALGGVVFASMLGMVFSCSKSSSSGANTVSFMEPPESSLGFFDREGAAGITKSAIDTWSEKVESVVYNPQKALGQEMQLLQEVAQREGALEEKKQDFDAVIDRMKKSPDMAYLASMDAAFRHAVQSDAVLSMKMAQTYYKATESASSPEERERMLAIFAAMGLSQKSLEEYRKLQESVREIQEDVDQACDLLKEGGGDIVFLATTLDSSLRPLEDIERNPRLPLHIALAHLLDIPQLKEKLFEACSSSLDLIVQERLSMSSLKRKIASFQELQALALLSTRLSSKGDMSRLKAIEAMNEASFHSMKGKREVLLVEKTNHLGDADISYRPDSLSVSILYPPERIDGIE